MESHDGSGWEEAVLDGGPAHGMRIRVTDRPAVLQVTYPVLVDAPTEGVSVQAHHVYRKDLYVKTEPLRYGFDEASP
ncbi:hypothetical protein [Streptomyces sp. NPDC051561]|uniref:hypothetical protein n=1 Tax=Streptomyces sp. NPDC051561 TaxID=3365658 RepID=UPI0037A3B58D